MTTGEEFTCNAGDLGSTPGLGRSSGEGNGYPLQHSGLENPMNSIVHGVAKSWARLSDFHFHLPNLGVGVVVCHIHELISTQLQTQWGSSADL